MKDFYYILGLDPNCNLDEIKEAYRKLSKKLHPDLNQGDEYFENRFKDIKEAFETLRDPVKRRIYDEALTKGSANNTNRDPSRRPHRHTYYKSTSQNAGTKPGKLRRKGPGIGLSITMIILGGIFAVYTVRWLVGAKAKKQVVYAVTDSAATPQALHKKHKHKRAKMIVAANTEKKSFDTAKIISEQPSALKPIAIKSAPVAPPVQAKSEPSKPLSVKPKADSGQTHNDYLYATYVHPNVTGVVPLREHDRFNANVIAAIPANSRVLVLERGNTYYRVFYDKTIGFVPKWSLIQK